MEVHDFLQRRRHRLLSVKEEKPQPGAPFPALLPAVPLPSCLLSSGLNESPTSSSRLMPAPSASRLEDGPDKNPGKQSGARDPVLGLCSARALSRSPHPLSCLHPCPQTPTRAAPSHFCGAVRGTLSSTRSQPSTWLSQLTSPPAASSPILDTPSFPLLQPKS